MNKYFTAKRSSEDLILSKGHKLVGCLAQFLTNFQLDGVRFIYKNFEESKSCILNDESGLGKTVVTVAFLKAILTGDTLKKCLIVVKDDDRIQNWRFHLNTFAKISEKVIENNNINIDAENQVYLGKWTTLYSADPETLKKFNLVIVDDRGEMMASIKCLYFLLKLYQNKVFMYIGNVDVTLDLRKFHNILKLCGRLEDKFRAYQIFKQKFALPDSTKEAKSGDKKLLLEAYFQRREKIINYCREFRLRRYCHQFEDELPLIDPKVYESNLKEWKDGNFVPSLSSSSSIRVVSTSSEKDAEQLLDSFFKNDSNDLVLRVSPEKEPLINHRRNSETLEMPSLMVESDSEDMKNSKPVESVVKPSQQPKTSARGRRKAKKVVLPPRATRAASRITRAKAQKSKYLYSEILSKDRAEKIGIHRTKNKHIKAEPLDVDDNLNDTPQIVKESQSIEQILHSNNERRTQENFSQSNTFSKNVEILSDYDFGLDLIDRPLFTSNNSSELQICQPDDDVIIVSSSLEDNVGSSARSNKAKDCHKRKDKNSTAIGESSQSFSPDIFETPESNEITFAGKIKSRKGIERMQCLELLEKDFPQRKTALQANNNVTDKSYINTSPVPSTRPNKSGPLTKYLIGAQKEPPRMNDASQQTSIEIQEADKFCKTPKNPTLPQKSASSGKKFVKSIAKTSSTTTTPNSLTKWLMKSTLSENNPAKPKRKLNFWFSE